MTAAPMTLPNPPRDGTLPVNREGYVNEPRDLSTADVIARAGCTYRQLDYWCRTFGLCGSDRQTDRDQGSGHPRHFTRTEARAARTLRMIGEAGVNVGLYARGVLDALHALPTATFIGLTPDTVTAYADEYEMLGSVVTAHPTVIVVRTFLPEDFIAAKETL